VKEDNVPKGVLAENFLGDVTLGYFSFDLSQCELFQLRYVVLETSSARIGSADTGTRHLVGKSVDGFG